MGSSLNQIKSRIEATKKTLQITSAMQMVSAAKLSRSEQLSKNYEHYFHKLHEVVVHLAKTFHEANIDLAYVGKEAQATSFIDFHDLLIERPIKKTGYLVISSDQGLAGNYNTSVFQSTLKMLKEEHHSSDEFVLLTIGSSAKTFFQKQGIDVCYQLDSVSDFPTFDEVHSIIAKAMEMYRQEVFDALYVCYTHHVNAMMSTYLIEQMLPLAELEDVSHDDYDTVDYVFEPSPEAVLEKLLPQYAEGIIFGTILDAKTAEHAARMVAMRSATDNANQLIDSLKKLYNQQRQAAITQEITEIVGGTAALQQDSKEC